ncbi:MAG: BlaI/MecI/CopY family transcriptional regulator [Planctomycetaceae bacterium]|nr:BlaI/MecI/CopY family transcriptional regulator [Planctomycetaceae bacterium]
MERQDYFLEAEGAAGESDCSATWARLKNLTANEATAVECALKTSSRPFGFGSHEDGRYELYLMAESSIQEKNPGAWLAMCHDAEQGEEFVATSFNLPPESSRYCKYHIIVMAKRFADLVRDKLSTTKGKTENQNQRFVVWDVENEAQLMFDPGNAISWGPVSKADDPIDPTWLTEECLYRHGPDGWTLLVTRFLCEPAAPVPVPDAKRLDSIAAVRWLMSNGFPVPADVAHLREKLFFVPGPPAPIQVEAGDDETIQPCWDTERDEGSNSPKLSDAEQIILDVLRNEGKRMTTNVILSAIEKKLGAASEGTTKTCLATLVRRGLLTNRQDVIPKGYGLPEW